MSDDILVCASAVQVRPSGQAGGGLGVFAKRAIPEGTVVTAFEGYAYLARDPSASATAAANGSGGNRPLEDYEKRLM